LHYNSAAPPKEGKAAVRRDQKVPEPGAHAAFQISIESCSGIPIPSDPELRHMIMARNVRCALFHVLLSYHLPTCPFSGIDISYCARL
jgi:hypothetical protein